MNKSEPKSAFKIEVHEEPAWRRVIDVEVPLETVSATYSDVYGVLQKKAKFPGFRPGKAPREIVEKRLAPEAQREVLNMLISSSLEEAYRSHKLVPISDPKISNVQMEPGEAMRYRVEVDIRPTVVADNYNGLVVEKKSRPISGGFFVTIPPSGKITRFFPS